MSESPTLEPKIGFVDPETAMVLTGIEFISGMGNGNLPLPPMLGVMPARPHSWNEGQVEFRAKPEHRFANPMGSTHGGWIMTMLDTAMGVAAHSTLARGESYTSVDTSVRFVRAIPIDGDELRIMGRVLSRGRRIITVEGRIETVGTGGEPGKLCATGTSSCMVLAMRKPDRGA
ncbi:MAG: PaaI family thioesterase [Pseudomonadota bacterium]